MTNHPATSAHARVVADYFRTTSAVSGARDDETLRRSISGLRLRLGRWWDAADKDIVDLGSGTGELCRLATGSGARSVIGVNLSAEEIAFCRSYVDAQFVQQDVAAFLEGCPATSIDRIFALNILEHLDKDTLLRLLEAAHRALRPGGQLIAMVPNATSPFGGMTRYWDVTHHNAFTPASIRQLSRLVGFHAEFRECGPIAHGLVSGIRYILWQTIRLGIAAYLMIELASTKGGVYTADMMFRLTKVADAQR